MYYLRPLRYYIYVCKQVEVNIEYEGYKNNYVKSFTFNQSYNLIVQVYLLWWTPKSIWFCSKYANRYVALCKSIECPKFYHFPFTFKQINKNKVNW